MVVTCQTYEDIYEIFGILQIEHLTVMASSQYHEAKNKDQQQDFAFVLGKTHLSNSGSDS